MKRAKSVGLILCVGTIIFASTITHAQEIAILKSAEIGAYSEAIEAFKSALPSSLQVTLEYGLKGDLVKGRSLARRIRASDTQIVLAVGLKAALAAKLEIFDIPIITCLVLDPKRYGLPSKNMVGLSLKIPFKRHLKPLKVLAPKISRIGVLFDPRKTQGIFDRLKQEATNQGITIISEEVLEEHEVSTALKSIEKKIEALWLLPDSTVLTEDTLDFIISSTLEKNIPLVAFSAGLVKSGAVIGVYINYKDIGRQAARLSQQLVSNTPSDLLGTILPPDQIRQSINRASGTYLGFPLPPNVLGQFDEQY